MWKDVVKLTCSPGRAVLIEIKLTRGKFFAIPSSFGATCSQAQHPGLKNSATTYTLKAIRNKVEKREKKITVYQIRAVNFSFESLCDQTLVHKSACTFVASPPAVNNAAIVPGVLQSVM